MKTSEELSLFLNFTRNLVKQTKVKQEELSSYEGQTQDILHQIELGSCKSRNRFATKLAHVRRCRRVVKDYLEVNSELSAYFESQEFVKVQRKLENFLGAIRNQEKRVENHRSYYARVIKDLPISNEQEEKQ